MMRYSEIPRDFSSDSLRFSELGEDQLYQNLLDDSPPSETSTRSGPALPLIGDLKKESKSNGHYKRYSEEKPVKQRKHSEGAANFTQRNNVAGYCNYSLAGGTTPPNRTQSLPLNASINGLDTVILNALRVSPEELAGQLTLLDFPSFSTIQPDELTSCAWTKKDKHIVAPNIVAFTKRFNHTSFWTVQEILGGQTTKHRGEIMGHFIKVAKKLFEFNNLHSLFAIISAMQTASIFRLTKTWSCLSKKEKQTFDRLADIFNDRNNWINLREHLDSLKLPCIPYLGLFLTDLVYIDLAHPHSGGLEPEQRRTKMNNILRIISSYQGSDYGHITPIDKTQKYLQSIRYIEELQNIFEEDQYKKSLKLEPPISVQSSSSCSSKESVLQQSIDPSAIASLNLSPAKASSSGSMRLAANNATKFIPGHRKCRSLGSNIFNKNNPQITPSTIADNISTTTTIDNLLHQSRHLLDDSVIEDKPISSDAASTGSSEGVIGVDNETIEPIQHAMGFQGCVRRKTVLKEGRKPAVASWQRYWLQIWANSLVYFPPKSFKGTERCDFKREPCKVCSLDGWSAQIMDNVPQMNTFQLINTTMGTVYKFRTGSAKMTALWLDSLHRSVVHQTSSIDFHLTEKQQSINLMTFE